MRAKQPLRVAVLADTLPPRGHTGVGISHYHLLAALKHNGLEVRPFVFMELPKIWVLIVKGLTRTALWILAALRHPWRRPGMRLEFAVDLLGALSGRTLLPEIISWNPDWIIVPDYGAVAALWPQKWRERSILVSHSNPLRFLNQPMIGIRDPLDARLAWWLEARVSRLAAATVAPSKYMKGVFERDFPHKTPARVIPNLVDEAILDRVKVGKQPCNLKQDCIFFPSPDNPNKGRIVLIPLLQEMARLLAPQRVCFVISGAISPTLRSRLNQLPPHICVHAPGPLGYGENIALMKACQLCVSPTLIESFGMALLEAQYCGLPVVAFKAGATAELVSHGRTGSIVGLGETQKLAAEAVSLIKDKKRLERYGRAGRLRAKRLYSRGKAGKAFADLLKRLPR